MYGNRLIDWLSQSYPDALRSRLTTLDFVYGDALAEAGAPITRVLFPRSGLISMVVELRAGDRIEAAMVGHAGAVGAAVVFGATHQLSTALAQLPGSAWVLKAEDLTDLARANRDFADLLFGHERFLLAQAQQTAACNAKHTIPQRLSSWLLRAQDMIGADELLVTQEHLAQMLGVQRASVSMFASQLQDKGLIHYRRGRLRVADADGLAREACECHACLRRQHRQLFGAQEAGEQMRAAV